jgi:RNA polymerase sigma factor (sigma-70 family)
MVALAQLFGRPDVLASRCLSAPKPTTHHLLAEQYQRHSAGVFHRCLMLGGGDVAWAEDVMQDVFVRLFERREELDLTQDAGAWLYTVAYRLCIDRLRRERRIWNRIKQVLAGERAGAHADMEKSLFARAELREIHAHLEALPPKERAVLMMKHIDGMSQRDIAAALGHSEGFVSKLLARAMRRLADEPEVRHA